MPTIGTTELFIILVIVIILFGIGRISKIAGEMGSGISAFRNAIRDDEEEKWPAYDCYVTLVPCKNLIWADFS